MRSSIRDLLTTIFSVSRLHASKVAAGVRGSRRIASASTMVVQTGVKLQQSLISSNNKSRTLRMKAVLPPLGSIRGMHGTMAARVLAAPNRTSFQFIRQITAIRAASTDMQSPASPAPAPEGEAKVASQAYPFSEIERKWQQYWEENKTFRTPDDIDISKPKYYVLDMFPYPRCAQPARHWHASAHAHGVRCKAPPSRTTTPLSTAHAPSRRTYAALGEKQCVCTKDCLEMALLTADSGGLMWTNCCPSQPRLGALLMCRSSTPGTVDVSHTAPPRPAPSGPVRPRIPDLFFMQWRWAARRPPRGLHRHGHYGTIQADAWLQCAASHGLGLIWPAGRAICDPDGHTPAHYDGEKHQ